MTALNPSDSHTTPATSCVGMYTARQLIIASAGATTVKDSDATTYSSSGAQLTTGASGAGGLGNDRAWFIVQMPGGVQWCFQVVSAASITWRVKVSISAGFVTSPGATVTPSASDELVIHGGGTDASPTGAQLFPTDGSYRLEVVAESTYGGWTIQAFPVGGGSTRTLIQHDPLEPGSYPTGTNTDAAPWVFRCAYHASNVLLDFSGSSYIAGYATASYTASSGLYVKRCQHGTGSAAWRPVGMLQYYLSGIGSMSASNGSGELGTEPYNASETPLPVFYARRGTQGGVVGKSTQVQCATVITSRASGDVLSQAGTPTTYQQRVDTGWVPWAGTTVTQ